MSPQTVRVRSIDEEYRYIEFNAFECGCRNHCPNMRVKVHTLHVFPKPLTRFSIALRLYDSVDVQCTKCLGEYRYWFDISNLAYLSAFKVGPFGWIPICKELIEVHMDKVREVQDRLRSLGISRLRFMNDDEI